MLKNRGLNITKQMKKAPSVVLNMLSIHLAKDASEYLYKTSCPSCGSSDANAVYSDGHHYCFSCTTYTHGEDADQGAKPMNPQLIPFGESQALPKRGLTEETCRKYRYSLGIPRTARTDCYLLRYGW